MTHTQARDNLIHEIEGALEFRRQKAVEYPEDERNEQSADELEKLLSHVQALPSDHPLLVNWANAWDDTADLCSLQEEVLERFPGQTDVFARFGFHAPEDPEDFCMRLSQDLAAYIQDQSERSYTSNPSKGVHYD